MIKKHANDGKSRDKADTFGHDLGFELDELNECSALSRDGSEGDSSQPFLGKTYSLNWRVISLDCLGEVGLQEHANLNSLLSYIKKTHLEEKSVQRTRRARFLSEDTSYEVNMVRRRNFKNERNNSFMNLAHFKHMARTQAPFKILKDELVGECLSRRGQKSTLSRKDLARMQLVAGEEKGSSRLCQLETKWKLRLAPNSNKQTAPPLGKFKDPLKQMFQLAKYLKSEISREMRVNKKRIRCSEHSMKAKKSDKDRSNYKTEQSSHKKSEKYFSTKDQKGMQDSDQKSGRGKTQGNSLSQNMDFEIDEEVPEDLSKNTKILIKFRRHF